MATVLEIINEFCDRINQPRESAIVGATTPAARQYLSLFKEVGEELLENPNDWPQLKRIYTFTITTGTSNYQLPGDFHKLLLGTQYGVTTQIPLAGPISNAQLAFQTYGVAPISPYSSYQINGAQGYIFNTSPYTQKSAGYFQISPTGQNSTDQNVIAYQSQNWCWPRNWTTATAYSLNDIRTGINNIYICTDAITSSATRPSVTSGTETDGDGVWTVYTEPYAISNDSDFCLFDTDLMVEGLRAAWYESKQQFAMSDRIKAKWLNSIRSALGRQNGAIEVNAAYNINNVYEYPHTPVGDWTGVGDV